MGCHMGSGVAVGPAEAHEHRRILISTGSEVVAPSTGCVAVSRPRVAPAPRPPLPQQRQPSPPPILKACPPPPAAKARRPPAEEATSSSSPEPLVATPPKHPSASRFGPRAAALREASKRAGAQTARKRRQLSLEALPAPRYPSPTSIITPSGASSEVSARSPESTMASAESARGSGAPTRGALDAKRQVSRTSRHEQIELALAQVRDVSDLVSRLRRDAGGRDVCCGA